VSEILDAMVAPTIERVIPSTKSASDARIGFGAAMVWDAMSMTAMRVSENGVCLRRFGCWWLSAANRVFRLPLAYQSYDQHCECDKDRH
jgi:hypothetical protein